MGLVGGQFRGNAASIPNPFSLAARVLALVAGNI